MSNNIKVAEATTQKKPTFNICKHAHLCDIFSDFNEYERNKTLLRKIEVCNGLQYVEDNSGDFIQCILWLDNCQDIWLELEELINDLNELSTFNKDIIEQHKSQQALITYLNFLMVENDLDFIFI